MGARRHLRMPPSVLRFDLVSSRAFAPLRGLHRPTLPARYPPSRVHGMAVLFVAAVVGVTVGSTRALELPAAVMALMLAWAAAAFFHRLPQYAVAVNVLLAMVLSDVLGNVVSFPVVFVLLTANVCVLLAVGFRGPVQREDLGLVVLSVAVVLPYLTGGPLETLPGALGSGVAMYATGRSRGVSLHSFAALLLAAGAVHGAIALSQSVPSLSSLIPFEPLTAEGLPFLSGRASGLFNNPNTLGTFEAVVLVIAIRAGLRRWMLPLVVFCAAGLILSSSREAVFGLIVGLSVLGVGRFRQAVSWATIFAVVGAIVVSAFPSLLLRFDVSGYSSDPNLLGRFDAWRVALDFIERAPLLGYGVQAPTAIAFVDNAYLGWLVVGGVVGLVLWLVGTTLVTPRSLLSVLAAMFAIAFLANPFSGPVDAVFLSICGAAAADNAHRSPRLARLPSPTTIGRSGGAWTVPNPWAGRNP